MNWNQGVRPAFRTSLGRAQPEGQVAHLEQDDSTETESSEEEGELDSHNTNEAGVDIKSITHANASAARTSVATAARKAVDLASPGDNRDAFSRSSVDPSEDLSNDEEKLYGESTPSVQPPVTRAAAEPESDDYDLGSDDESMSDDGEDADADASADGDDSNVLINVRDRSRSADNDLESGELTESSGGANAGVNRASGQEPSVQQALPALSTSQKDDAASDDDGDAMMSYADASMLGAGEAYARHAPSAAPAAKPRASTVRHTDLQSAAQSTTQKPSSASTTPLALADLSFDDLELQLRYFHFFRPPATVPLSDPARCLDCGAVGHMQTHCPSRTCPACSAVDAHPAILCPTNAVCPRCRTRGHSEPSCPSKLKPAAEELPGPCLLCNQPTHPETHCELLWRTSGRPWLQDLPDGRDLPPSKRLRLYCYECGSRGHLGNDCATRRPGKPLGSSSWTAKPIARPPRVTGRQGFARRLGLPTGPPPKKEPRRRTANQRGASQFQYRESPAASAAGSEGMGPTGRDEDDDEEFFRHRPQPRRGGGSGGGGGIKIRGGAARGAGARGAASRGSASSNAHKAGAGGGGGGGGRGVSKRGGRGGRGAGGGGETFRPMPSSAARAWKKTNT